MERVYIFLILINFATLSVGQFGPGGVGNNTSNGVWLRAGDITGVDGTPVSSWDDFSSYGNNANQADINKQPQYFSTSSLNNQPIVRLDGTNDELAISDNNVLDGTNGLTYYTVLRPNNLNGSPRGILGKRVAFTVNIEYAYTWFFWSGNRLNNDVHTQNNRYNSGTNTFTNGNNYVLSFDYDGTLPLNIRSRMFSNGTKIAQARESSTSLPNSNQDLAIGALNVGYGTYLGADFGEIIQFNYSLDSSEHIIVSNYLAAKYGITLNANDLYNEDDPINGNYDFQVCGIGRINSTIFHDDSQGDAMLRIHSPSNLNNNEFMFWGHDGGLSSAYEYTDIPPGVQARFNRVWRVSEVTTSLTPTDIGSVTMTWDLSNQGPISASDLRLLIDSDGDGNFNTSVQVPVTVDLGGGFYEFQNVSGLSDGVRFTMATINSTITPLPVELTYFDVHSNESNSVIIEWITASEINNSHFEVQKSKKGYEWEHIQTINGAGKSVSLNTYSIVDDEPFTGTSYYRLKQVDFNGEFEYSEIRSINIVSERKNLIIFPNPTSDHIKIKGDFLVDQNIKIFNVLGQDLSNIVRITKLNDQTYSLNLSELNQGIYLLNTNQESYRIQKE